MKLQWFGSVVGVQPRIDLGRSFDQRYHSYLGYLLLVDGDLGGEPRRFTVRIGPAAQSKHEFRAGDRVRGMAKAPVVPESETADLYMASALQLVERGAAPARQPPPWLGVPPALEIYRARGHRRLDPRTYEASCRTCQWGCRMAVTMVIDQWKPHVVRRRFETFCYGPKSCPRYRAGPARTVPGRKGMTYVEEDWVDEDATGSRGPHD
jgi:hypothetical protein